MREGDRVRERARARERGRGGEGERGFVPVFPEPGEELFSSLLEDEERTPPDVFSDLSTVLLSIDLQPRVGEGGERERERERQRQREVRGERSGRRGRERERERDDERERER